MPAADSTASPIVADHHRARADRVVVTGNREVDRHGIDVRVDQADDRNAKALGLGHGDHLAVEVDHEDAVGNALHVAYAAEVELELRQLGLSRHALLGRQEVELSAVLEGAEVVEALDPLRHRVEVGEEAAQPALVHVRHAAAVGPFLDGVGRLLLRADEEDGAALAGDLGGEAARLGEEMLGLEQVDDVDAVVLPVDVGAHARVPAARLVAEMQTGLKEFSEPLALTIDCSLRFGLGESRGASGTRSSAALGGRAGQGPSACLHGVEGLTLPLRA